MYHEIYHKNKNSDAVIFKGNQLLLKSKIKEIFSGGEQGFYYDPNDLTAEKINWRKNLLLNTEDFIALSASGFSAVKAVDGWALTASLTNAAGWALGALYPIGSVSANVGTGTIVRSIEFKKGTANEVCLGGASDTGAIFIDLNTLLATRNAGNLPYVITPLSDGWYRLEMWHYTPSFATTHLSHMFGWGMTRTSSGFDAAGQVGSTIYARKPSFAFVPYESTATVPYQAITDFNSDFIKQFPLHTLYQDFGGTIPVTIAGQTVGLMLDKSKGLTVGGNVVTNGGFDIADGWLTGAGRTVANGIASWDGSSTGSIYQPTTGLVFGNYCEITYTIKSITSGGLRVNLGGNFGVLRTVAGTYTERLTYGSIGNVVGVYTSIAGTVASIDDFSARKVLGNHAYQTVSTSRPILRINTITNAKYLEFDGVDDYMQVSSFSLSVPFSIMHCIKSISDVVSAQTLLSSGISGYTYIRSHSSFGVQQSTNDPQMSILRDQEDSLYHRSDENGVFLKSNKASSLRTDLIAKNPFDATNKWLGRFNATSGTAASMRYYGGIAVARSMTTSEESAMRQIFNKRIGV